MLGRWLATAVAAKFVPTSTAHPTHVDYDGTNWWFAADVAAFTGHCPAHCGSPPATMKASCAWLTSDCTTTRFGEGESSDSRRRVCRVPAL